MARNGHPGPAPPLRKSHRDLPRPDFGRIALVLQGGGALGSYQAGAYEALEESGLELNWITGISIGAINAAIIAGNPPGERVPRLRSFWNAVSIEPAALAGLTAAFAAAGENEAMRAGLNHLSALSALALGVNQFFRPRWPPPWVLPDGAPGATSLYDIESLGRTLEALVDFDRINHAGARFSVGAVNVRSGHSVFFDSESTVIGPEHILASAALPPMFPAIEIEGQLYWDGGLVSNTPLQWVLDSEPHQDTLVFQVDLWNTRGEAPRDLPEVITREREILYASRTRTSTETFRRLQRLRNEVNALLAEAPEATRRSERFEALAREAEPMALQIVQLIYHAGWRQGTTKDYEFSRFNICEHWSAGYVDAVRTLRHPEALNRPAVLGDEQVGAFDVAVHGRL